MPDRSATSWSPRSAGSLPVRLLWIKARPSARQAGLRATQAPSSPGHPSPVRPITARPPGNNRRLAADRLVSPVPLPPDCPASTARVKIALRASQAIEQAPLLTRTAPALVWQLSGGRGECGNEVSARTCPAMPSARTVSGSAVNSSDHAANALATSSETPVIISPPNSAAHACHDS